MRYLVLALVVTACSSSSESTATVDAGQTCEPRAVVACDCGGGRAGWATCGPDRRPGGCDCARTTTTTNEGDGGAPDANCTNPTTYYRDLDGDGFGSGIPTPACSQPANYSLIDGDCDDTDARAFPGQTAFFETPRPNGSFDFECNPTAIEKRWPVGGGCGVVPVLPSGMECRSFSAAGVAWSGDPPECGVVGSWFLGCLANCVPQTEPRTQACR